MDRNKSVHICQHCGYQSLKWQGRCPDCGQWNSFIEEATPSGPLRGHSGMSRPGRAGKAVPYSDISGEGFSRIETGIPEFDRVLGGGLVPGSLVLVGGDPGIGKSTLLMQVGSHFGRADRKVLYVTAEESEAQIKMRGDRLGIRGEDLLILADVNLESILQCCEKTAPQLVVIDSIQTIYSGMLDSLPGNISQVKEAASRLMLFAKNEEVSVFLIGHITKDGAIAGPKSLEHMVDTVLYFEGEKNHVYRVIRTVKNRFGPANELGIFEMRQEGLFPVVNPSGMFLKERSHGTPGTVIMACLEGSRPFLVELQALVTPSAYGTPRRMATGVDHNRVSLLLAVIEKKIGIHLREQDVFVNVVGGITITEPAADLAIILAVASSFKNRIIGTDVAVFGEVGLTGEVRSAQGAPMRLNEAAHMGFARCLLPAGTPVREEMKNEMEIIRARSINEAVEKLL